MRDDIKRLILEKTQQNKEIAASSIVKETGFSRAYINTFLQELREEGRIIQIGKTKGAKYVIAEKDAVRVAKSALKNFKRSLKNQNLSEQPVLDLVKNETGIFFNLSDNIEKILEYAFTEMLNNAIEHSKSNIIDIRVERSDEQVRFNIIDHGIGIYNNIIKTKGLNNELEAIQDLLKGKQTTDPEDHTGEGIFFTSKVADNFIIRSSRKKLLFNNLIDDLFIQDIKYIKGTRITFVVNINSSRSLKDVFNEYSDESYEFSKTRVVVRLYKMGSTFCVSRSQARRVMNELDKFKEVVLDFSHITAGQAFADEIFRVWQSRHPGIKIIPVNMDDNAQFMITRAKGGQNPPQGKLFS